jgi:hypothetical protein
MVVMEYFTKWIEVKPLVNIAAAGLKRFFWKNIICHFGVPRNIIVDNAKQFDCHIFKDFYHQTGDQSSLHVHVPPSKGECTDIHSHKEDTRGLAKRQMDRRIAKSNMEP